MALPPFSSTKPTLTSPVTQDLGSKPQGDVFAKKSPFWQIPLPFQVKVFLSTRPGP